MGLRSRISMKFKHREPLKISLLKCMRRLTTIGLRNCSSKMNVLPPNRDRPLMQGLIMSLPFFQVYASTGFQHPSKRGFCKGRFTRAFFPKFFVNF